MDLLKSRIAKIGVGGTGLIGIIFTLQTNMTGKIDRAEARSKEHIELKLAPFEVEVKHLSKEIKETKNMVKDLHNHFFKNK